MNQTTQIFPLEVPPKKSIRRKKKRPKKQVGVVERFLHAANKAVIWLRARKLAVPERKLRLCESVSLGDKRFAAVLEYEGHRFLIGGAAQSVQLLTALQSSTFSKTLAAKRSTAPEAK